MHELLKLLLSIFTRTKATESVAPSTQPNPGPSKVSPPETPKQDSKMEIDWTNPKAKVSKYFTVKEVCYLPSWNCLHIPTEEEKTNIIKMAEKMDIVREFLGKPINTHCWLRPGLVNCPTFDPTTVKPNTDAKKAALAALDYNAYVGGAKRSAHKLALAVDFDCGESCDDTRSKLEPKLEEYNMRMEQMPGGTWVHLDMYDKSVSGGIRFFKP